jgi:hypothetical protein
MDLGIYTPYGRGETTMAALRLADLALAMAMNVSVISSGPIEQGVHPYWDSRVRSSRGNGVYLWAKGKDVLYWFGVNEEHFRKATLVAELASNCLVPMWHRIPECHEKMLFQFDRVVAPSRQIQRNLIDEVFQMDAGTLCCTWDSGLDPVRRSHQIFSGTARVYVPMDGLAIDTVGNFTLHVLGEALRQKPNLIVTLDSDKSWPRQLRRDIRRLMLESAGRLHVVGKSGLRDRQTHMLCHDWTLLPQTCHDTGYLALASLACCTPIIAYDVNPISEIVRSTHHGLLMKCDVRTNWLGAPTALPLATTLLDTICKVVDEPGLLHRCRRASWSLDERQKRFIEFWSYEWNLCG